jgi:heme-degrading monooxygenase HmoA
MICRLWRGWTKDSDADKYDRYLRDELFPRVERELTQRGYRGYHVLRLKRAQQVEFVTMVWFESLDAVKAFAGDDYEIPVISERARGLLTRYAKRCEHYDLSSFRSLASRGGARTK